MELQTSAARYVVKAPRAGRVEAIPYKLGERPAAGTPLIVMLADGAPYARVYVPEPLRTQFLPGTRMRVRVDGRDGDADGRRALRFRGGCVHAVLRADAGTIARA